MSNFPSPFSSDYSGSPPPPGIRRKRKLIVYDDEGYVPMPALANDEEEEEEKEKEEEVGGIGKPIGNVAWVTVVGGCRRRHYNGFEANGVCYVLEDTVLVAPDDHNMTTKPSVAIIKDISATEDGKITVTGQRFYRLEVAENASRKKWQSSESRELFYSFDKTEFPAYLVMHKCQVHFIPPNKEIPRAKDQPGFIVRKVYDSKYKEVTELVDSGYDDCKQHEINLLVEKTIAKIPQLAVTDEVSVASQNSG